jgi:uncharacterized protein YcfJ
MKKMLFGLALVSGTVLAQDVYVISTQPRYVTVQQQQCHSVNVTENNSGIGTVIGAVAGGVIGHQVGRGFGRDVATVLGTGIGASVGQRIGQDQQQTVTKQVCDIVPVTMQQGETVTFNYKGRVFTQVFGN